jgi:hypothetical protein
LKIIEEWVKGYKSESLTAGDGSGEAGGNDSDEEESKQTDFSTEKTPYSLGSFKEIMHFIVCELLCNS